jgi:hypothetical protein
VILILKSVLMSFFLIICICLLVKRLSLSFATILQIKNIHYDYLEYSFVAFLT